MEPPSPTMPDPHARLARLRDALDEFQRRSVIDALTLANWRVSSALAGAAEIAEGEPWPAGDPVAFERHTVTIPAEWHVGAVRLDLDAGGAGHVRLHSRLGQERHPVGAGAPWVPVPTRAFGIRIEVHRGPPTTPGAAPAPRLGRTRLVCLDPARLAAHARLSREATAIDLARAAGEGPAAIDARLAAIEAALGGVEASLGSVEALAPGAARAG